MDFFFSIISYSCTARVCDTATVFSPQCQQLTNTRHHFKTLSVRDVSMGYLFLHSILVFFPPISCRTSRTWMQNNEMIPTKRPTNKRTNKRTPSELTNQIEPHRKVCAQMMHETKMENSDSFENEFVFCLLNAVILYIKHIRYFIFVILISEFLLFFFRVSLLPRLLNCALNSL